jgi:hypothetical protein
MELGQGPNVGCSAKEKKKKKRKLESCEYNECWKIPKSNFKMLTQRERSIGCPMKRLRENPNYE